MLHLTTARLKFRNWTLGDFPEMKDFFTTDHSRFVGGPLQPEPAWRIMAAYVGHLKLLTFGYPAIIEKSSGKLVGTVGIWNSEPWPEPELGYWLLPHMHGKGYGSEAGKAVLQFAQELGLPSLVSYINQENTASIKLATGLGAHPDGEIELLSYGRHQIYRYF